MRTKRPIKLRQLDELRLPTKLPFDFRLTLWKPSHFPTGLECHTAMTTWRTFRFGAVIVGLRLKMEKSTLVASVFSHGKWTSTLRDRLARRLDVAYGLSEDISTFLRVSRKVPAMRAPLKAMAGMRISCPESLFEIAVISLLLQNTTIKRSIQMMGLLLDRYGTRASFDGRLLKAFFSPADLLNVPESELRAECRLGYRAKYLPRFAAFFATQDDDELRRMPPNEVMSCLQIIKGVGPYTANIVTSHALRDWNAIPLDVWNRKILAKALLGSDDAEPQAVRCKCESVFPNCAGLASLYLIEHEYMKNPMCQLEATARQ